MEIEQGLFDIGVVDDIEPAAPSDADFKAWCKLFVGALHATYTEDPIRRPMNLADGILPGGVVRSDGFPTEEDVASAYGVFRLVMRVGTEEKIQPPQPPNIAGDVTAAVQQVLNQVAADLGESRLRRRSQAESRSARRRFGCLDRGRRMGRRGRRSCR